MKKILVFGGTGMAGHMITLYLSELKNKYELYNVCHKCKLNDNSIICDITDFKNIYSLIDSLNPDVIINCVGILNTSADIDIKNTVYVNTFFPQLLSKIGKFKNIKIIHLSTDCVFTGKSGNYTEESFKDEFEIYGLSKSLGEIEGENSLTIRTSIIGPELKNGTGLFNWFMHQNGNINGFTNVYWNGVTTLELAKVIDHALDKNIEGIYNISYKNKINKAQLLHLFKNEFKKDSISITEVEDTFSDKSIFTIKNYFNYEVISYEDMLREMHLWMNNHKDLYSLYF